MEERMIWISKRTFVLGLAALGVAVASGPAGAADATDLAAAKAEGKVSWYTSTPIETANRIAKLFEEKTGIKVEMFRSGGTAILRRFMQEYDAKHVAADVLTTSDPAAANQMAEKGVFVAFKPEGFDKIPDEAKDADGRWIAQRLNMMTIFVRTDKVAEADRPKTWSDLTNAKYKGMLVTTDPSFTSLQISVVGMLTQKLGWEFYEKLRQNDMMIVQGNQQVSDNLKRGERLIAAGALDSYAADDRKDGHPIATVYPTEGTFVIPSPTGVVKGSPNPNAAKAFADFMLGRTVQELFPHEFLYSARTDVAGPEGYPPLASIKVCPIDYDYIEAESPRIRKRFAEVMQ
jgi:iron(III) transport system substrate-binding protein